MSDVLLASVLFVRGLSSMVLGPWTVSWEAGVCQRLQFLVWMARGRHPFSGSFLHEWPSSRQTDVRPGYAWERVCVGLIILAAPLDAFLCDFCRKLISSRHVCTHHHTRCPLFAEGECLCKRSLQRICVSFYMNNGNLRLSDILNCH